MDPLIRLLLGVCGLYLSLVSGTSGNRAPWSMRPSRSVNRPTPINCRLGSWTPWASCNSCTEETWRFRYVEKAAQFGGSQCHADGQLWERQACPVVTTPCIVPDVCGASFTCNVTDRCISQDLLCDGESDCREGSDEEVCEVVNLRQDKCSTLYHIPGAERAIRGYNILTGDFMVPVLDHTYFGGQCEYVYNGEWRKFTYDALCETLRYNEEFKNFRKPYNYHTYRFVAQARAEGSYEYYNDVVSLLNARKTQESSNFGVSFGVYHVEAGLKGSKESEFLTNITKHTSKNLGFVSLQSKVQTARFKMRSNGLMLDEDMHRSLKELPDRYDVTAYFLFLNTYGTHYVTEGTMGGSMEYILVVNKTAMASSNVDGEKVASCFGGSIGVSFPVGHVTIGGKIGGQVCGKPAEYIKKNDSASNEIEDIITRVKGGITEANANLLTISDPESYRKWGESLPYSPALIEYETMPIYELVRLSTAADYLGSKLVHLRRAWDEYQLQFSTCRCAPCRHNGIPILRRGTSCSCECREGYRGSACEETDRDDKRTDGQWSCWGVWSSCRAGRKTRTRACNNPPPDKGGANCLGSTSQSPRC